MTQKVGSKAHLLQLLQNALIYAVLFQIDPRRLDDIRNDLLIDVTHSRIRHVEVEAGVEFEGVLRCVMLQVALST